MRTATPISDCVLEPRDRIGAAATATTKCIGPVYRARYDDPMRGRFVQEDLAGVARLAKGYAYVRGNPLRFIDTFGLCAEVIQWGPAHATSPIPSHIPGGWPAVIGLGGVLGVRLPDTSRVCP